MIRSKQMDELRRLHSTLRELGSAKKPSLEKHVMIAITSGELPKLKPAKAIAGTARDRIISSSYGRERNLSFADVFSSCNGYEVEMKQFSEYERKRRQQVNAYERDAEKIMLRAMNKDADPEEISEALHEAAERAGLKALTVPVFGAASEDDE